MSSTQPAQAARAAYRQRAKHRARQRRAQTQELRLARERLALAYVLRRELETLATGAGDLARCAQGAGRAAQAATARLQARRRRAAELSAQAERFALELGLAELDARPTASRWGSGDA